MSYHPLAAFRRGHSDKLHNLADQHIQEDLTEKDRATLKTAANKLSTHATIGSLVGLGLGIALAWKIRSDRLRLFHAFRAMQKPTHVKFADGREEAIPDIEPLLRPTAFGDIATYTFFSIAGLFLGGETGIVTGFRSARRITSKDPETKARVEKAYRHFRADVLRKEIELLDSEKGDAWMWN